MAERKVRLLLLSAGSLSTQNVIDALGARRSGCVLIGANSTVEVAFTALSAGPLSHVAFQLGTEAQDADDRIIYDTATGALRYDADGVGSAAAVQFGLLQTNLLDLNAAHFLVV